MRTIFQVALFFGLVAALGVAIAGCGSSVMSRTSADSAATSGEKMGMHGAMTDKMGDDKMGGDKMGGDKMGGDKMATEKMSGDKMAMDKMGTDKMSGEKMTGDKMSAGKMGGKMANEPSL